MSAGWRIVRYVDEQGQIGLGRLEGEGVIPLQGALFGALTEAGPARSAAGLRLLTPVVPGKIVGVGSNYKKHAEEMGKAVPPVPKIFLKPASAVVGPDEAIRRPAASTRVDHEAELGVVIGRRASGVSRAEALSYVYGYTVVNDVTARDFQKEDGVFARAKGFDTFCPIGPCVAVGLDPADLGVRAWVNGALRQDGRTSDMAFDVATLIAFISDIMTLEPGDVIATGTPSGVGPLVVGDVVEVEVEGVGRLRNPVVARGERSGA